VPQSHEQDGETLPPAGGTRIVRQRPAILPWPSGLLVGGLHFEKQARDIPAASLPGG